MRALFRRFFSLIILLYGTWFCPMFSTQKTKPCPNAETKVAIYLLFEK
jgi:hypothetical protein